MRCVGAGAFGQVYKVKDHKLDTEHVAKVEKKVESEEAVCLYVEAKAIHMLKG